MMKKQEKRRIEISFDFSKQESIERNLSDVVEVANERVIPLARELKFEISLENVLRYVSNSDEIKSDYIKRDVANSGLDNKRLIQIVEKDAGRDFDELFLSSQYVYDDVTIQSEYAKFILLEKGVILLDDDAIREAATVYIQEPEELEAYDRQLKAVDALNDFFNGKAPEDINHAFFGVDGVIKAGTRINYKYYSK